MSEDQKQPTHADPTTSPQNETAPDTVWMACRATPGCKGNHARVMILQRNSLLNGGGVSYRYRCTTCNRIWHLTV